MLTSTDRAALPLWGPGYDLAAVAIEHPGPEQPPAWEATSVQAVAALAHGGCAWALWPFSPQRLLVTAAPAWWVTLAWIDGVDGADDARSLLSTPMPFKAARTHAARTVALQRALEQADPDLARFAWAEDWSFERLARSMPGAHPARSAALAAGALGAGLVLGGRLFATVCVRRDVALEVVEACSSRLAAHCVSHRRFVARLVSGPAPATAA